MKNVDSEEKAIRELVGEWAQAIRDKDVDGVRKHFAPDSVRFYMAPPLQTAMSLKENLEGWFDTFRGAIGYEIRDLNVVPGGDLAYSHSFDHITGTKTDGTETDVWFRDTMCFKKMDGCWLIVHAHESVPFYMEAPFKAALDLQP